MSNHASLRKLSNQYPIVRVYKKSFFRSLPSCSPMDERFDGVRDGCNPLKLYRLNKYRKGAVLGGG